MAGPSIMTEDDNAAVDALQNLPEPAPQQRPQRQAKEPEYVAVEDADLQQQPQQPPDEQPPPAEPAEPEEEHQAGEERPREPRAARRERQKTARDRNQQELLFLRRRVGELEEQFQGLEPRLSGYDTAQAQAQLQQLDRDINTQAHLAADARRRLAEAVTNADPEQLNKALEDRDRAIMTGQQLSVQRNMMRTGDPTGRTQPRPQQPPQRQQAARVPSAVQDRIDDFASRFDWYNPYDPRSTDSKIVLQLDQAVAADGYDPASEAYWSELEARMKDYLPKYFAEEAPPPRNGNGAAPRRAAPPQQQPPRARGPQIGAPGDRAAPLAPNQVYISPARKAAMILAGALDSDGRTITNHDRYKGYLKQYADYDRANGVAR